MGNKLINETYLTDTANAIRTKLGVETKYKPSEFANAILSIPSGSQEQALCFSVKNGDITLNIEINGTLTNEIAMLYKKNDGNWTSWFNGTSGTFSDISLTNGDKVYLMNATTTFSTDSTNYCRFVTSGDGVITLSGNINSLICYHEGVLPDCVFYKLFYENTHIVLANSLTLPSTQLGNKCYYSMFDSCSNLLDTPKSLPATTLAQNCYQRMFMNCFNLRDTIEKLPATNLQGMCYAGMFQSCKAITKAPEIMATSLDNNCMVSMFKDCSALITAPSHLYATTNNGLAVYNAMFQGCTSLTTPPIIHLTELTTNSCYNMFNGCSSLKVTDTKASTDIEFFTCPSNTSALRCVQNMFTGTGGTYTSDPIENGVYYYYK